MKVNVLARRTLRLLGKAVLSCVFLLVVVVGIVHIPFVQRRITNFVSDYLSTKIQSRVDINEISFSIFGRVEVLGIGVWDRDEQRIFSAEKISVGASVWDLLRGDVNFENISITDAECRIAKGDTQLNIQFIIDAFTSPVEEKTTAAEPLELTFNSVSLDRIKFVYSSTDGPIVNVQVGTFNTTDAHLRSEPLAISADKLVINGTSVNIITASDTTGVEALVTRNSILPKPDFGTGIALKFNDLQLADDSFSFHRDTVFTTEGFSSDHLVFDKIRLAIKDLRMNRDSLTAIIGQFKTTLGPVSVEEMQSRIQMANGRAVISGFRLQTATSSLKIDADALFNDNDTFPNTIKSNTDGVIDLSEFSYFTNHVIAEEFSCCKQAEIKCDIYYNDDRAGFKNFILKTETSKLQASGKISEPFIPARLRWDGVTVNAKIGNDVIKAIKRMVGENIDLPSELIVDVKSSGSASKMDVNGIVTSAWGRCDLRGFIIPDTSIPGLAIELVGNDLYLDKWLKTSSLGTANFEMTARRNIGDSQVVNVNGMIIDVRILNRIIHDIQVTADVKETSAVLGLKVNDHDYNAEIQSNLSFAGPFTSANQFLLHEFSVGKFFGMDSTLALSCTGTVSVDTDNGTLRSVLNAGEIAIHNSLEKYLLDTLNAGLYMSGDSSSLVVNSKPASAQIQTNADLSKWEWVRQALLGSYGNTSARATRTLNINASATDAALFRIFNIPIDTLSMMHLSGNIKEADSSAHLNFKINKLIGYGLILDSMSASVAIAGSDADGGIDVSGLLYDSIDIDNVRIRADTRLDTTYTSIHVSSDTSTTLRLLAKLVRRNNATLLYPQSLSLLKEDYALSKMKPVEIQNDNVSFDHFSISRDDMRINLNGDLNAFEADFRNVDVTPMNYFISHDTTVIRGGHLHGAVKYHGQKNINLKLNVDSLLLFESTPFNIQAVATSDGHVLPFDLSVRNSTNFINVNGDYNNQSQGLNAKARLHIANPELFSFLVSDYVSSVNGTIDGHAVISGNTKTPNVNGAISFNNFSLATVKPQMNFLINNDSVLLRNLSVLFNKFKIYDDEGNPLVVDGYAGVDDKRQFEYDLRLNSDQYALINHPDSTSGRLRGSLVIDSDVKLKGDSRDTKISADIRVKDATNLTLVTSPNDVALLKAEGIVDFVDPEVLQDTILNNQSDTFYDSLVASLPDFNLQSTIILEKNAMMKIVIDPQSGDYIQASGDAKLELGYDRTGNLSLVGDYAVNKGLYRVSFYDLVKKNFTLVNGSAISWHGNPQNGDLKIKATHVVQSNSIGLVGNEIAENEKSIYKRSLDYEVGININGTIQKPIISFSLDLPQNEKDNYPVLANKLERLRQPEYESELNKQVFGLLVLGGFIPETSGGDINSNVIATTALYNSVNSLLASQLNRFASQYIKGVSIDVGIQSFSDYSAPGGKTETAMDFRVTKSVMNDRLSFEIGGDFDINQDQSGANTGNKNYRGDIAIIYDLTGNGDKKLKLFNNETYDIIYQEIRNTGVSLIFIREFNRGEKGRKGRSQ